MKHLCPICNAGMTCRSLIGHAAKWNDLSQEEKEAAEKFNP